ncbi:MAG TPA: ATP-dependent helicase HrpB [Gemmatimonadaceae bacterium]
MLPIVSALDGIRDALRATGAAVIHAPPGAGKTTIVPPALLDEPWLGGNRIVMLEPRRLAARAAAQRIASLRNEPVGRTVGYRTRLDTRVSAATRIEVVTEGVLTRMLQDDPTLHGYGLVIFDEFHERSVQGDVGLALTLHSRALVRPDLRVLVMSATIDGTAVASLLDGAPIITSLGRQFEVETRFRPPPPATLQRRRFDAGFLAGTIHSVLAETRGDVLVFLPGAPEIHQVERALQPHPPQVDVVALHGSLQPGDQDRAIEPAPPGRRKVVLATSIAETSLTIEGVRVVIDSGLARRSRFSPRSGMSRLETLRVSRASADQRRGRAGRTAPGTCYRLWSAGEDATLLPFAPPEIIEGDLAPLALDLAVAGIVDPEQLRWLDAPPAGGFAQARELLRELDAIDGAGRPTAHGRAMSTFGMHPRLSHMLLRAAELGHATLACQVAAILVERDPLRGLRDVVGADLRARVDALQNPRALPLADQGALRRAADQARRWRARLPDDGGVVDLDALGRVVALAFPDRVAKRRPGPQPRYVLRNGSGATVSAGDALSREAFMVVAESDGRVPESAVWLAAAMTADDVMADFGAQIEEIQAVEWNAGSGIEASIERRLGAIVLSRNVLNHPDPALVADALAEAIGKDGLSLLPWTEAATALRQRLAFLHAHDPSWPDMSDAALLQSLIPALRPMLSRARSVRELHRVDIAPALRDLLTWQQRRDLDELAPSHFEAPTGTRVPIDYSDPRAPGVSIRLQELFGVPSTPALLNGRVALTLHLLSPAHRPVQVTRDLAGFWRSSYYDVRKDMKSRYPKHPWPDDPLAATPTKRIKPR